MATIVCKHCGNDCFHETGTIPYSQSIVVEVDKSGSLTATEGGSIDTQSWDRDRDDYVCSSCERSSFKLEDLVIVRLDGADLFMCSCGHPRHEHNEQPFNHKLWVRGLIACEQEGCACRDYDGPDSMPAPPEGQLRMDPLALGEAA